jgi:hypothetical protein
MMDSTVVFFRFYIVDIFVYKLHVLYIYIWYVIKYNCNETQFNLISVPIDNSDKLLCIRVFESLNFLQNFLLMKIFTDFCLKEDQKYF